MRYFFDTRQNGDLVRDDTGIELEGLDSASYEASRGLADLAWDALALPGQVRRDLGILVRDEAGREVLQALLSFELRVPAAE
jgi:hypothetical protein